MTGSAEPPLDPSGDEARRLLIRELVHPDYQDTDVLGRIARWLERWLARTVDAASGASPLAVAAATVVAVALIVAVGLLASRARSTARSERPAALPALTDDTVGADEWRSRAEHALARGDASTALVDAFRAMAVRQVAAGRIDDLPQATARELADALSTASPVHGTALGLASRLFDEVLYGDHVASPAQAHDVLALDLDLDNHLAGRRTSAVGR